MADAVLRIDINQGQSIPNSVEDQGGFTGQAESEKSIKKANEKVSMKKALAGVSGAKVAWESIQLAAYYEGNQVLINQINRGAEVGKNILGIGAIAKISPAGAVAYGLNELVNGYVSNVRRSIDIRRQNLNANEQRNLFNTNLNNGRYIGGQR